jgi:hypothetical protein
MKDMMQLRFTFALGLAVSGLAMAQGPRGGDFEFMHARFGMDKVVKGAPYSAQAVTQHTQTLADGNHIQTSTTASVARDSEGRSRREVTVAGIGALAGSSQAPKSVFIHDPVAGASYILEPATQTAHQTQMHQRSTSTESSTETAHAQHSGQREHSRAGATTVDLGTQVMSGLTVQGKQITHTIPAGQVGNEKPLQSVTEIWYSEDLKTIVMSKTTDPRGGQTVYQLTNITRAEPDAALFQVPAGYKVTEGGGRGMRGPQ